jgi:ferric-dicitrate binding protein FerR (iron transport regulator)
MRIHSYTQRALAALLVFLLSPAPLLCQQTANQQAGDVANIDPAATRNGATTRLKDSVYWNDHLKTDTRGRLRVALRDGSSLSLGSDSELVVVQHDATSQQTSLQLLLGRIREKVVKLTQPNSKFETNTPHASLGVIGTDFYVEVTPNATKVIVYSGVVRVTPLNVAADAASGGAQSVNVGAGQSVTVTSNGILGTVETVSQAVIQTSIANTVVTGVTTKAAVVGGSHLLRNLLIGLGAAGAGVGIGVAVNNSGNKSSGPSIPPK